MLNAMRDNDEFARLKVYVAIAQAHSQTSGDHKELVTVRYADLTWR
jgi:hypothetical protein